METINDYRVRFRSEKDIQNAAALARSARKSSQYEHQFNIVEFVERDFAPKLKGGLLVVLVDGELPANKPAKVTYNPTTLTVETRVWREAREGHDRARWIVAHELGHIVLHDNTAKAFSSNGGSRAFDKHYSAEWQADTFASFFLMPDQSLGRTQDASVLSILCGVSYDDAADRIKLYRVFSNNRYEGDFCPECGNFTMARNGTCLKCDTCGATTGCS